MASNIDQICIIDFSTLALPQTIPLASFNPQITQISIEVLSTSTGAVTFKGNVGCVNAGATPAINKAASDVETIVAGTTELFIASQNTVLDGTVTIAAGALGYLKLKF